MPVFIFIIIAAISFALSTKSNEFFSLIFAVSGLLFLGGGIIEVFKSIGSELFLPNLVGLIIGISLSIFVFKLISDKQNEKERIQNKWEAERPQREQRTREEEERRKREIKEEEARTNKIKEIELKGMNTVLDYEKGKQRKPQDVSSQNLGYDIFSSKFGVDRFIEVKAKSHEGDILITENEWKTAEKFGFNYYLYVVLDCDSTTPYLYIINNPSDKFTAKYDHNNKKYKIPISQIKELGIHVN